ncbi:MAG: tryptophan 7-halogenase, partial [Arenicella sp.]|nr:tryptophan 7-halogenase [Arenicella sp.]
MMTDLIENIVIVGADLHGWTMALGLISELGDKGVSITVVGESREDHPGVLSLDAPAHAFHQRLGFKEASLIAAVGGSYRYGIKLNSCDNHLDRSYKESVFSYSPTGEMLNNVEFHHYLARLKLMGKELDLAQYSLTAQAAAQAKFTHPAADSTLAKIEYNLQFDGLRYTSFLQKTALD